MKQLTPKITFVAILLFTACSVNKKSAPNLDITTVSKRTIKGLVVNKKATDETTALFYNLKLSSRKQVMFGHMEDNKNGYDGWRNVPGRSDVFEVTGAYPIVYGFDFGGIASLKTNDFSAKEKQVIHDRAIEAFKRNGIVTFSWHYNNPVSKGSFYWEQSPVNAVSEILPGGKYHGDFKQSLAKIANFAASVKVDNKLVPIIFRPFHEFDGNWFWWGKSHCTTEEYKALYQFTVTYLRDSLHVRNFLYAWSPDCNFDTVEKYTERYPGNDYVDVAGMDDYTDLRAGKSPEVAASKLKIISDFALQNNKVAAFTETGLENIPQADWFTNVLLKALKVNNTQIAYVMLWSNRHTSYWTPYKGHPAEADFIAFKNDPYMAFSDKAINLYQIKQF